MKKFKKTDIMKIVLERRSYKKPSEVGRLKEAKRQLVLKELQKERELWNGQEKSNKQ